MTKIRVLIADDHAIVRAGLRLLINEQRDMTVVGEAEDGPEAVAKARKMKPDVLVMDLSMPGGWAMQHIEGAVRESPKSRVLALTMHDDPAYARAALAAGASGYVAKRAAYSELLSAIRAVHKGRTFVNVSLAGGRAGKLVGKNKARPRQRLVGPETRLSPREEEVLALLVRGHTNREIAEQIRLSVKTVETYHSRLAKKLGLHGRADFVRYAVDAGLLESRKPAEDSA